MSAPLPTVLPFRHVIHHLREPEQFAGAVSGVNLSADFLARQSAPTRVEQFQTTAWALDFHEAHVKARVFGALPPGWASVGLMRSAAASSWYGMAAGQGVLVCNPPGEPIDGCITPGFSCLAISVPVSIWEECRALAGIDRSFGCFTALHLPAPVYRRLERQIQAVRRLLLAAASAPECRALAIEEVKAFIVSIVTTAWELSGAVAPPLDSVRNRMRLARRAESWMRAHLGEAVRIPDVCLALRVSRRELEYAFHLAFDQSPRDFLHALRLNAIRRTLQRGEDRIIQAALDHGITHLGRLAGSYRQLFGEAPSETLRRVSSVPIGSRGRRRSPAIALPES